MWRPKRPKAGFKLTHDGLSYACTADRRGSACKLCKARSDDVLWCQDYDAGTGALHHHTSLFKDCGQQHGFFHGGIIVAVGNTAGGYAALTVLPSGSEVLTQEYKINFLRPAAGALLKAEGLVLRAGRSVIGTRVDVSVVTDGNTTLCSALQQSIVPAAGA